MPGKRKAHHTRNAAWTFCFTYGASLLSFNVASSLVSLLVVSVLMVLTVLMVLAPPSPFIGSGVIGDAGIFLEITTGLELGDS